MTAYLQNTSPTTSQPLGGSLSLKRLTPASVLALCTLVTHASAQENELSGLIGRTFIAIKASREERCSIIGTKTWLPIRSSLDGRSAAGGIRFDSIDDFLQKKIAHMERPQRLRVIPKTDFSG